MIAAFAEIAVGAAVIARAILSSAVSASSATAVDDRPRQNAAVATASETKRDFLNNDMSVSPK
jgi:hypothetical protein